MLDKIRLRSTMYPRQQEGVQPVLVLLIILIAVTGLMGAIVLANEAGVLTFIVDLMAYIESFNSPFAIGFLLLGTAAAFSFMALLIIRFKKKP